MPFGRPSLYTPELGDRICELVATNECGLDELCELHDWMPNESSVRLWRFKHLDFSTKYLEAKQQQAQLFAEQTFNIARQKATYIDAEGNERVDQGHVAWQKMNVGLRQWHASKLAPKVYGDQKQIEQLQDSNSKMQQELEALKLELSKKHKKDY